MMIALIVVGVVAVFVYQHNNLDKLDEVENEEIVATPSTTPTVSDDSNDEYGSSLWLFLDGTSTVFDIVNKMKEKFPSEQDKMLNRVITFFHTLQVNEFILQI
jgi:hypothetical protein